MEMISSKDWYLKNKNKLLKQVNKRDYFSNENLSVNVFYKVLEVISYFLIVVSATVLLVTSSLEVLGNDWQGWLKAILIEVGILALAVSKNNIDWVFQFRVLKDLGTFLFKFATLIFLFYISFNVLHTGVESQRTDNIASVVESDTTLSELISEKDNWQKRHDDYAINRHSDKRDALKEISRLNQEIRKERAMLSQSSGIATVNMQSNTEMLIRAVLLLLNIIFGHKLAQELATIKWLSHKEKRSN